MRLSLSINDRPAITGSLTTTSWLGAHVSLSLGDADSFEQSNRAWIAATDTSEEPNSTHSDWEAGPIAVGDTIEIKILPDGKTDSPTKVMRTSESPRNLFSDIDQARSLLAAIKTCDTTLKEVMHRAHAVEPPDEFEKVRSAVWSALLEMDRQLTSPTLRRYPELLAEAEELKIR